MHLTGSLFAWRVGPSSAFRDTELSQIGAVRTAIHGPRGWSGITLTSPESLLPGKEPLASQYQYSFVLREGKEARVLVLSTHSDLVTQLLRLLRLRDLLQSPRIRIPELVSQLSMAPEQYRMTAVFGKVVGFGQSIRSLALYGRDLADAVLFKMMLPALRPYRVELREMTGSNEPLSFGSFGDVSFSYRDTPDALRSVDKALVFLQPWISWDQVTAAEPDEGLGPGDWDSGNEEGGGDGV